MHSVRYVLCKWNTRIHKTQHQQSMMYNLPLSICMCELVLTSFVSSAGGEADAGLGCCGWLLVIISFFLTLVTFPISVWMCIKVRHSLQHLSNILPTYTLHSQKKKQVSCSVRSNDDQIEVLSWPYMVSFFVCLFSQPVSPTDFSIHANKVNGGVLICEDIVS